MESVSMNYAAVYLGNPFYDATDPDLRPAQETDAYPLNSILYCIQEDDLKTLKEFEGLIIYYEGCLIDALNTKSFKTANWCHKKSLANKEKFSYRRYQDELTSRFFYFNKGYNPLPVENQYNFKHEQDLIARLNQSPLVKDIVTKFLYPTPYEEKTTSATDNDSVEGLGCPPSDV
jgi:hypothetical protein